MENILRVSITVIETRVEEREVQVAWEHAGPARRVFLR